jgi:hypothetical protein
MKVFDRFTGTETELPSQVEPGRYRLLTAARLNRVVDLAAGDVLWSDGSGRCLLSADKVDSSHDFCLPPAEVDGHTPESLLDEAIDAVAKLWRGWRSGVSDQPLPSPVMPAELGALARLNPLEHLLQQTLAAGHLQTIAQRPRMDMRYDTELLPVSRTRRVAGGAGVRLAAHSEDWARREITGVVPSRLLAEVSEDELGIYENQVFACLLDRLARLLRYRQRELTALLAKRDEAGRLSDAEKLDYRLRDALCRLWGRAFDADESQTAGNALKEIRRLLGQVRQLQRSPVAEIAVSKGWIASTLRNTNILEHDPHYRHLRPLWQLAHADLENVARTPAERFERVRRAGEAHGEQIGLLIHHALESIRKRYDRSLTLTREGLDWLIGSDLPGAAMPRLRFVPARRGQQPWDLASAVAGLEIRHVVFSHPSVNTVDGGSQQGGDGVLNPLEFYGVERIQHAIEHWLMRHLLRGYPFGVRQVPDALRVELGRLARSAWVAQGRDLALLRPLVSTERGATSDAIAKGACNERTRQGLRTAIEYLDLLAHCRVCGAAEVDWKVSEGAFQTECKDCNSRSVWRRDPAGFRSGEVDRPFAEVGHLALNW